MSIRYKVLLSFLLLTYSILLILTIINYNSSRIYLVNSVVDRLNIVADIEKKRLQNLFNNQIIDETTFESNIRDPEILSILKEGEKLGKTGEILLGIKIDNKNGKYISPLKQNQKKPNGFFKLSENHHPMVIALTGYETDITHRDTLAYRNNHVIAVTRYFSQAGIGMVVSIDRREALDPLTAIETRYYIALNILAFLASIVVLYIARSITIPIINLTEAVKKTSKFNLPFYVTINRSDELGILGKAYNKMTAQLTELNQNLESKVIERTHELAEVAAKDEVMLSSIGEGIIVIDKNLSILKSNKAANHLLMRDDEMIFKSWIHISDPHTENGEPINPKDLPEVQALQSKKIQIRSLPNTVYYTRKDGSRFPVAITASPVQLDKQIIGIILTFRDISEEKSIDKAKTEFVSLASHQLKTPLTSISWNAEVMKKGEAGLLNQRQKEFINQIYDSNNQMIKLVNTLLDITRIELGTININLEKINPAYVIQSILNEISNDIEDKSLFIIKNINNSLLINADPTLWKAIIQNLITNAVKYTPAKGVIHIKLDTVEASTYIDKNLISFDGIIFSIEDSGIGIPSQEHEQIFNKMYRASNAKKQFLDGTGLGLYLVKKIIELTNGLIWFNSVKDKGTTFYVVYPIDGMNVND